MARRNESIGYILVHDCPWWGGVIAAGVVYSLMCWVAPHCFTENMIVGPMCKAMPGLAWMGGSFFLALAGLAALRQSLEALGRRKRTPHLEPAPALPILASQVPACPSCHSPMVERTSKRGANAGTRFWGCAHYPKCTGTRPCH
ncbi:MAG: topoisomerase DNA-binding C4 zinc finger domain-containing protein [Verrucomicrobiaceae bacterium]|nr:topoisomerase DNA-binding C4 zinc finger domain-containing protein [Verrucomicrobiaceae bacterium]